VSGDQVSNSAPIVSTFTIVLIGLVLAMATILLLVGMQKGVLKRRKR
jgi:hypothetical protein